MEKFFNNQQSENTLYYNHLSKTDIVNDIYNKHGDNSNQETLGQSNTTCYSKSYFCTFNNHSQSFSVYHQGFNLFYLINLISSMSLLGLLLFKYNVNHLNIYLKSIIKQLKNRLTNSVQLQRCLQQKVFHHIQSIYKKILIQFFAKLNYSLIR